MPSLAHFGKNGTPRGRSPSYDLAPRRRWSPGLALASAAILALSLSVGASPLGAQVAVGSYTGNGAADRTIAGAGFAPAAVIVKGDLGEPAFIRTSTMAADQAKPLAGAQTPAPAHILSLTADGFRVGSAPAVNQSGVKYQWIALAATAGVLVCGSYTGDGEIARTIGGHAFAPGLVLLIPASSAPCRLRTGVMPDGMSATLGAAALESSLLTALTADGFAVTGDLQTNESGVLYHYVAIASYPGWSVFESYVGDGNSNRVIGSVGFRSSWALVKAAADPAGAHQTLRNPTATSTLNFAAAPDFAGGIKNFTGLGFSIDANAQLNAQGQIYYYAAFYGQSPFGDQADLTVSLAADADTVGLGDIVHLTATMGNLGPVTVSDATLEITIPSGLQLQNLDLDPDLNVDLSNPPQILVSGSLAAAATRAVVMTFTVASGLTQRVVTASLAASNLPDPEPANNVAALTLIYESPAVITAAAVPFSQEHRQILPGGPVADVLRLRLFNEGPLPATLSAASFTNPVDGPYDQKTQDSFWTSLQLHTADGTLLSAGRFADGRFAADGLVLGLAAGDSLDLILRGAVALSAPDGALLRPSLAGSEDLSFAEPIEPLGAWPLAAPGTLTINGMTAAQITLHAVGPEAFQMGSVRNRALDVVIPGNGGQPDVLNKLNVVNLGDATPGSVLTRVEAWADDGDGVFNAATDLLIGRLYWTGGGRFEASALSVPIAATGLRVFVTVDVAADAIGGTVRLSLPAGDDVAINVSSGNDGPIDEPVANPYIQTITASDRVIVTTAPVASRTLFPGTDRVPLLHLVMRNLYSQPQTLHRLRLYNRSTGAPGATQADLDGTASQLFLQVDGNGNGMPDGPQQDPVAATAAWHDGQAVFEGMQVELAPDAIVHLFLAANVSLLQAADGDSLGAAIGGAGDLQFLDEAILVGAWPLDSGARHRVRGMVAAQVSCPEVPPISLAAGDGPALALDFTVPGNGYLADALQNLRLTNLGTASTADIAALAIWADDGDGLFDPATDSHLFDLTGIGQEWLALNCDLPIPASGQRLFAGLTVTTSPGDSTTVRLAVPQNGLDMLSSNDGPHDAQVASPTTLLISTAPLLSSFSFPRARSTTDMTIPLTMQVVNVGGEQIDGIAPVDLAFFGLEEISLLNGPQPASLDLAPGTAGTFTWLLAAAEAGGFQATGLCRGIGAVGGQTRSSLNNASAVHRILEPAIDLSLYPATNLPFSINRGQTNVIPMTLTLLNEGGPERADLRLERLVITLDDGEGGPVAPADVLARAIVNEGVLIYCVQTEPETAGQTLTLDLWPPVVVTEREPATLSLQLDISSAPRVSRFRVGLQTGADLTVVDAISGLPRAVALTSGAFPVQSSVGTIVTQADGLLVEIVPLAAGTAGAGQDAVELLRLACDAQGDDQSTEVKIGSFAVSLCDTTGAALADPSQYLNRLWVQGPLTAHSLHLIDGPGDSTVAFTLTPPITVPVGSPPLTVSVLGRIAEQPLYDALRLRLAAPQRFDVRDGNIGLPVPVAYQGEPPVGPIIVLQESAAELLVEIEPLLPAQVALGVRNVSALKLRIAHPGAMTSAAARLDTLQLICLDGARRLLDPRLFLDACCLLWNDELLAGSTSFSADLVAIPLNQRLLAPGAQVELTVLLDIRADAQVDAVELLADHHCLAAYDANLGAPLALLPDTGQYLPGSSGVASLQPLSVEVVAAWQDRLPALLPTGDDPFAIATLVLTNPAPVNSAPLELVSIRLRTTARDGSKLPPGAVLSSATALLADSTWSASVCMSAGDSLLVLAGAQPLILPAGAPQTILLLAVGRPDAVHAGLSLGLLEGDLACRQPGGQGSVVVRPASGQSFPFWTASAGLAAADLADSYLNYPNPFAAGREPTTFAFNLQKPGRVSLRIWTPRGEQVLTLLRDHALPAGLHQDQRWDGRNGRGQTVLNGVYLAELTVEYLDGGSERLLRKVAVVR